MEPIDRDREQQALWQAFLQLRVAAAAIWDRMTDMDVTNDPKLTVTHDRTNAERQRRFRERHGDSLREKNAARMRKARQRQRAQLRQIRASS